MRKRHEVAVAVGTWLRWNTGTGQAGFALGTQSANTVKTVRRRLPEFSREADINGGKILV